MKKILSVVIVFFLLGGFLVAQNEPEVSGSAKLSWGIDFGSGTDKDYNKTGADNHAIPTHGFYNEHNLKIRLPLFKRQSFAGGSADKEAPVYADVSFKATPGTGSVTGTNVSAVLHFYGAYITVYPKPDFSASMAIGWQPINGGGADDGWFTPTFTGWGTKIGYKNDDFLGLDVGVKFASNGSWDQKYSDKASSTSRRTHDSMYAIGLDFEMEPVQKFLGIEATLNATLGPAFDRAKIGGLKDYGYKAGIEPSNVGGKADAKGDKNKAMVNMGVALTSSPLEGFDISLGFDGVTGLTYAGKGGVDVEVFGWDVGLSASYKWVDFGFYTCGAGTQFEGKDDRNKKKHAADMAMHIGFASADEGDTNFVPGLDIHTTLNMYKILTYANMKTTKLDEFTRKKQILLGIQDKNSKQFVDLPLGFNIGASYKASIGDVMWIKPYFDFYGETNHFEQHPDTYDKYLINRGYFGIAYNIGLQFSPIEKAVVALDWTHGELDSDTYEGGFNGQQMIKTPLNHHMHNGTFTVSLTLKY